MIVTDIRFPAKTFSRLNVFHNFSLSACPVFTAAILHVHFDSAILGLYLFYFVIPIRKSGLVCTFESEICDFSRQYFNFSLSKNRTMGAKCNRLIVQSDSVSTSSDACLFPDFIEYFYHYFFSNFTDFFHFQNSLTLKLFFQTSLTHKPV